MFSLEPFLSIFIFLAFPIAIYPIQKLGRRMRKVTGDAQEELSNYTARLDETFQSIKIIKSFAAEKIESNRAKEKTIMGGSTGLGVKELDNSQSGGCEFESRHRIPD